ncbi:MAG: molybdopterin-dependent oxidoreductase [Acidimicrobiia bacterium]|nr:molybdopterin-dependent oxidoreductase [Acidimicrobiia bacterium]
MTTGMTRREFISVSSMVGGGLLVTVYLAGCSASETVMTTMMAGTRTTTTLPPPTTIGPPETTPTTQAETTTTTYPGDPNATIRPSIYVLIDGTGGVTVTAFRAEMGQGIRTAIAMIIAEELDAEWNRVRVEQAPADPAFGDQVTGGSLSVSDHYQLLRRVGAAARQVLVAAAAGAWEVDPAECRTEPGVVVHPGGDLRLTYGELVTAGIDAEAPRVDRVEPWKDPAQFRIIGTPTPLCDAPEHGRGATVYTNDITLPGMRYAVIARCPTFGGRFLEYDRAAALAVQGVTDVVEVGPGVAVVADHTWAALQGRDALAVEWDLGVLADTTDEGIRQELADRTRATGSGLIGATYSIPYFAHAALEPVCAVADVQPGGCEVWTATQDPQGARDVARRAAGLPGESVVVHTPLVGGKFGRGHYHEAVEEAVRLSQITGAPIKVFWTREDDLRHDRYHPMSLYQATAPASGSARPTIQVNSAGSPIPTGAWRSVQNFPTAFARESLIDEVAAANGIDPVDLRLQLMDADARRVIERAAAESGWGSSLPGGRARGIAYHATFGVTHVAEVVEVSLEDGRIRVHRVVCAVDCGTVVNPDTVRAQMEGGIVFGLTAALKDGISIEHGAVVQSNFDDYRLLPFDEMPEVEVHFVGTSKPPTGVGEMGVPPVAPAVANAVFALTGMRLRSLPLRV